jgi:hypothetical protein
MWGYPTQKMFAEACGAIQPKKKSKKGAIQPKKRFVEACGALQPKKSAEKRDPASTQWCQLLSLFACQPF